MSEFLSLGLGKIRETSQTSLRVRYREAPSNNLPELCLPKHRLLFWSWGRHLPMDLGSDTSCEERLLGARMCVMMSPTMLAYLPIMADFIPFRLTFMRPDEHLQLVFIKNLGGNIRSKVAAPSSTCVWVTASFASGITP